MNPITLQLSLDDLNAILQSLYDAQMRLTGQIARIRMQADAQVPKPPEQPPQESPPEAPAEA